MPLRAVILDLDGTVIQEDNTLVSNMNDAMTNLSALGLNIAIVSNRPRDQGKRKLRDVELEPDLFVTRDLVGKRKGSPDWVDYVCDQFEIQPNDLVYVGDGDLDMRSASHARVVYFNAGWSRPDPEYGINLVDPTLLPIYIKHFFMKTNLWHWKVDCNDDIGRHVAIYAVIDGSAAGIKELKRGLIDLLKRHYEYHTVGRISLRDFMMLHLLGSIYLSGLYQDTDWWTIYPGSRGAPNEAMGSFLNIAAKLFRQGCKENLIVRHKPSIDSGTARYKKLTVGIENQVNTICLNDDATIQRQIQGKRILVVDDFTTEGHSLECARNFLFQGGAADVVGVCLGKYGYYHSIANPRAELAWDPFTPTTFDEGDFTQSHVSAIVDHVALDSFRESYQELAGTTVYDG